MIKNLIKFFLIILFILIFGNSIFPTVLCEEEIIDTLQEEKKGNIYFGIACFVITTFIIILYFKNSGGSTPPSFDISNNLPVNNAVCDPSLVLAKEPVTPQYTFTNSFVLELNSKTLEQTNEITQLKDQISNMTSIIAEQSKTINNQRTTIFNLEKTLTEGMSTDSKALYELNNNMATFMDSIFKKYSIPKEEMYTFMRNQFK